MRDGVASSTDAAIARARTVFAVPGTSSNRTCPPHRSAASTSLISSRLPWTTLSMLSRKRSESSAAAWKRSDPSRWATSVGSMGLLDCRGVTQQQQPPECDYRNRYLLGDHEPPPDHPGRRRRGGGLDRDRFTRVERPGRRQRRDT